MSTHHQQVDSSRGTPRGQGIPRYQRAVRDQVRIEMRSLDQLLPAGDQARVVWEFVRKLDLAEFYADIRAVEGHVARSPVDPAILLALWLLATLDGIGSAREVALLSTRHLAYEWLCGEVGVNHHLLSDFRSARPERLEQLMVQVLAVLMDQGLVSLNRVAQDGMRVRASAGGSSFRRKGRLEEHLRDAQAQIEALKNQVDEDAGAADRRVQAAKTRAVTERLERVEEALAQLPELEAKMERRKKGDGDKARCSTTDPDARRMKMADGGTRPAYNVQLATTDETRLIVGWDVTNVGSDGGLMTPMVEQIEQHFDQRPQEYLTDGGFSSKQDIEELESHGTTVYTPVKEEEKKRAKGQDPFAPLPGDSPIIGAWRQRMGTAAAQAIYQLRSSLAEFPNAVFRNRGLRQFLVRGLNKVKAVTLWQVLAFNFTRIRSLGWLPAL
jgi:transposase